MVRRRMRLGSNKNLQTLWGQPVSVANRIRKWKEQTTERLFYKLKSQNLVGALKPVLPKIKILAPSVYQKVNESARNIRGEENQFVKKIINTIQRIKSVLPKVSRREVKGVEYIRIKPSASVAKMSAFVGSLREKMYAVLIDVQSKKPVGAIPITKERHIPAEKYEVKIVSQEELPRDIPIITRERGKIRTLAPPRKLPEERKPKVTPVVPSTDYDFENWLLSLDVCMAMLEAPIYPDFSQSFVNEFNKLLNTLWRRYENEYKSIYGEAPIRPSQINPNDVFFRWLIENGYIIEESIRLPAERYSVEIGMDEKGEWYKFNTGGYVPTVPYQTPATTVYFINGVPSIEPEDLQKKVLYDTISTACHEGVTVSDDKSRIVFVTDSEEQWADVIGRLEALKDQPKSPTRGYLFIGIFVYPNTLREYTPGGVLNEG